MSRPTAMIREVLQLQMMLDTINKKLVETKQELAEQNIKIVSTKETHLDIQVEFIADNRHYEGIYMRRMLEAEMRGYLRRLPDIKRHRQQYEEK